ncbi:heparinase II/III domain-containing protein [Gottfriedia acidiceleris]|uniref:heparinase II/III domain-containing protein n=1 Tax=Gottfriedia acidiceleris TaxID=371036 RepID=UPI00101BE9C1|nr:heparinase II/III family protein [Gottfriedia acidiceleris]
MEKKKYLITDSEIYKISNDILERFQSSFFINKGKNSLNKFSEIIPQKLFGNLDIRFDEHKCPDWHYAYILDNYWSLDFSFNMNIKQRDDIGDPRVAWEINRLQYLPKLAFNYMLTDDIEFLNLLKKHFYSWVNSNPFLWGVNWTSPMEAALRNISLIFVLAYLEDKKDDEDLKEFLTDIKLMILNQNQFVNEHYSQHSSGNNHLIVEMVSMNIVASCFGMNDIQKSTHNILEKEIIRQTFNDGVNKEQAIHYHSFVVEALLLWIKVCNDGEIRISKNVIELIGKMVEYIADMMDEKGNVPQLGDSDEGKIISFGEENHYVMVLDFATHIFNKIYSPYNKITSKTILSILGDEFVKTLPIYNRKSNKIYKEGGKTIFRKEIINKRILLTFEYGNLGMSSIFAHGHADALSINLNVNGIPIFVDPGTYIYNIEYSLRDRLRMSNSHNTISKSGDNFSISRGAFLWEKDYQIFDIHNEKDSSIAKLKTIKNNTYCRKLKLCSDSIIINDSASSDFEANYLINPSININKIDNNTIELFSGTERICKIVSEKAMVLEESVVSSSFTKLESSSKINIKNPHITKIIF